MALYDADYNLWALLALSPAAPGAVGLQRTTVDVGRTEWAAFLGTLITDGQVSYFKLGEGGWSNSVETTETFGQGIGTFVSSGTIPGPPLIPGSITIDAGGSRVATDQPASTWDGTGVLIDAGGNVVGTVNYKTNVFSVTFASIIPGGQDIDITRMHRGQFSGIHTEDISSGDGTVGPYTSTLGAFPIVPGSVRVTDTGAQVLVDDGAGVLSGDGSGTIVYTTGAISATFTAGVPSDHYARAEYRTEGVANAPEAGVSELVAESDSELATFQKTLTPAVDMVFQGDGTRTVLTTLSLAVGEGNDDGTSNPPFWTEGALYSENDVMLLYFTMPGTRKTISDTFQRQLELTARV